MEEKHTGKQQQHQHIASGDSQVVTDFGVSSDEMGANRSGSTSSTAGLVGGDVSGGCSSTTGSNNPPPRQSSKRDSGYHTDCSPATFSTAVPQFTFDPTDPLMSMGQGSGDSRPSMSPGIDCPQRVSHGSDESHTPTQTGQLPRCATLARTGSREVASVPPSMGRGYTLSPGWQPQRVVPEVSDDEDDDAFVAESVVLAAGRSAHQSRLATRMARVGLGSRHGRSSPDPDADTIRVSSPRLGDVSEETDERDDRSGSDNVTSPRRRRHLSSPSRNVGLAPRDDDDDDAFASEDDVATTDYIHAPLSLLMLPGGERIRPLIARTIATQTPHLHCQLIDQILDCPQGVPACARGSAVRRLRYYSEGEETVGPSYLPHGPLPDLVPVSHVTRERSLSAPDLETLQRQRLAAREVGRELRRISDEFLLSFSNVRDNQDGALAALHAELNGVAAFFLTGVRRFVYRNFAGYFRHVFNWTRRAMNSADHTQDSSVDEQR